MRASPPNTPPASGAREASGVRAVYRRFSSPPRFPHHRRASGSILVSLLWCLALLSLLVLGLLHSARLDLQIARHHADRIQARYLALAGVERATGLLYHDARERSRSAQSHRGTLFNQPAQFRDIPLGRGSYRVLRGGQPDEGGGLVFGVSDEESRLNLNTADVDMLSRLPFITSDLPPAILDWRDPDNTVTPGGGAEQDYYVGLQPPHLPRNGPFYSVRELLQVRGIPPDLFWGDDPRGTGLPPSADVDDDEPLPGAAPLSETPGWVSLLTVHSGVRNQNAAGQERVSLSTADEAALTAVPGVTAAIARAIIAHRGQNRFNNVVELLDVRAAPPPGQTPVAPPQLPPQAVPVPNIPIPDMPAPRQAPGGPPVIDQTLFLELADSFTTSDESLESGLINVNTAGVDVLVCLPSVSRELAHAIIAFRRSNGFLANLGWLLRVPGMTPDTLKAIAPRVTTRSETFRILAEGRINSSGIRQRLQTVVRVGLSEVETLAYREDDL